MMRPERFGPFLLFQETESNSYRSCYRAGLRKGRAVERIVRLEIFDRPGLNISRLKSDLDFSSDLPSKLRDPHIAAGMGLGQVEGTPFVACDFELGTTLAAFSRAARQQSFPVPFDQALFVVERIALALTAAYQVDHDGSPILHSFLTPDAVLLSNAGEVKVSGFEVSRALREQLAGEPYCAPYLAPECRSRQPPAAQDDVFSLGAILYELITGRTPPSNSLESVDLDALVVPSTGEPAPEPIRSLLAASFAPAAHRIPHVMAWHQRLGKLILDGEHNPTTFNLAFLLHTLLREPLERGVEDLEREKRFVLSSSEATGAPAREGASSPSSAPVDTEAPSAAAAEITGLPETADGVADAGRGEALGSRGAFWLGFSISCLTASVALGFLLTSGGGTRKAAAGPPVETAVSTPVAARAATQNRPRGAGEPRLPAETDELVDPSEPTAVPASGRASGVVLSEVVHGELDPPLEDDAIRRLVAERAAEIERDLKAEYERKLESLRLEVEPAETARSPVEAGPGADSAGASQEEASVVLEPRSAPEAEAPTRARPEPDPGEPPAAVAPADAFAPEASGEALEASGTAQPPEPAQLPGQSGPERRSGPAERSEPVAQPAPDVARRSTPGTSPGTPEPLEPRASDDTSAVPAEDAPPETDAEIDAPVETRAQLMRLSPPSYPAVARRLGLSATARVRVLVGPDGKVKDAEILGEKLGAGFDAAALTAARRSRWKPATRDGAPFESWSVVTLEFRP